MRHECDFEKRILAVAVCTSLKVAQKKLQLKLPARSRLY